MNLSKFTKNTGQIVRFYEMFIPKNGDNIQTIYKEMPVLLSHDNNVVVFDQYKKFQLLNIKKKKGDDHHYVLGGVHTYVRNWGGVFLHYDGIVGSAYSYQSEKVIKRKVHNSIKKLIQKEYGAYGLMIHKLEQFLLDA